MALNIEFPIECIIISIFIGYMYYYIADKEDILSWTTIKIGSISGLLLVIGAILYGLVVSNTFSFDNFFWALVIFVLPCLILSVVLVMIGGYLALVVKQLLRKQR